MNLWIVYKVHYEFSPDPRESLPNKYSGISFHVDELEARRKAGKSGGQAVEIHPGDTLEEAIRRAG